MYYNFVTMPNIFRSSVIFVSSLNVPMKQKTSFALHHPVIRALRSSASVSDNINGFAVAATNAFIASDTRPMSMRKMTEAFDETVCRESPFTFCPPRSAAYSLSHYQRMAKSRGVSLSCLVANAVAAALNVHPGLKA
jgi:hypothetical protein